MPIYSIIRLTIQCIYLDTRSGLYPVGQRNIFHSNACQFLQDMEGKDTLDLEKELIWIEGKYNEATSNSDETDGANKASNKDKNSNHTIADIEHFIDDSYLQILAQSNEQKDLEILSLHEELSHAYEVQSHIVMESAGLKHQLEELKRDSQEYHLRLCDNVEAEVDEDDLKNQTPDGAASCLIWLNMNRFKRKGKSLFKRKNLRILR